MEMKKTEAALVILAKNPIAGKVKTRLAKTMGEKAALNIYKDLYLGTLNLAESLSHIFPYVFQFPKIDQSWISSDRLNLRLQSEGDLGDRMLHALRLALSNHSKVVIIGADCPGITSDILNRAFRRLDQVDLVLGPSEDGGFYLLGARMAHEDLFLNRSWSHGSVFSETIDIAARLQLDLYLLLELYDIDFESDWMRWREENE
ncbi:MAG: DUF2064 domain-containing protein [Bacteroidetes bacterium]|jgi:rSAM/selenodomain-associated transferase 1|nr:DUF2064 domain-containing protein [Bacteroidota bacterium]